MVSQAAQQAQAAGLGKEHQHPVIAFLKELFPLIQNEVSKNNTAQTKTNTVGANTGTSVGSAMGSTNNTGTNTQNSAQSQNDAFNGPDAPETQIHNTMQAPTTGISPMNDGSGTPGSGSGAGAGSSANDAAEEKSNADTAASVHKANTAANAAEDDEDSSTGFNLKEGFDDAKGLSGMFSSDPVNGMESLIKAAGTAYLNTLTGGLFAPAASLASTIFGGGSSADSAPPASGAQTSKVGGGNLSNVDSRVTTNNSTNTGTTSGTTGASQSGSTSNGSTQAGSTSSGTTSNGATQSGTTSTNTGSNTSNNTGTSTNSSGTSSSDTSSSTASTPTASTVDNTAIQNQITSLEDALATNKNFGTNNRQDNTDSLGLRGAGPTISQAAYSPFGSHSSLSDTLRSALAAKGVNTGNYSNLFSTLQQYT